eukprot:TRINITY_DN46153_c0_g1_i1.p1 TRINITY_DN46153_c0_g1~~TRINITY_DN46153_c0_g1_i1.p1  ORF type:complete len:514 (+),score=64.97 TRINITY_DN46153_c0_g1_i1:41-1582(+)
MHVESFARASLTISLLAACAVALGIPEATPEQVGLDSARLRALDAYLHEYVEPTQGELAQLVGTSVAIARKGKLAHFKVDGDQVLDKVPMQPDTIFRLYSMSKPVTAITLMTFWEQAKFHLDDAVSMYLPAFAKMRVLRTLTSPINDTVPAETPITIRQLLTHTSGLSYGFYDDSSVDEAMRDSGFPVIPWHLLENMSLEDWVQQLAKFPLQFQPGTRFRYSLGIDVCGALVEALARDTLQAVAKRRVFDPLGMVDTTWTVPPEKLHRLNPNYVSPNRTSFTFKNGPPPIATSKDKFVDSEDPICTKPIIGASGGGGLCSTTTDYLRFAMMLLNNGELQGVRVLAPRTVRLIMSNNLPGGVDIKTVGNDCMGPTPPTWAPPSAFFFNGFVFSGAGFGLGAMMVMDPVTLDLGTGRGMYSWGGASGAIFFVDPSEDLVIVYMQSSNTGDPLIANKDILTLTHAAIIDDAGAAECTAATNLAIAETATPSSPLFYLGMVLLLAAATTFGAFVPHR